MAMMIDGPMINRFIENTDAFNKFADEKFELIDQKAGIVAESIAMDQDEAQDDKFEVVDLQRYKSELKEMMKAVAQGIGNTPVSFLVEEGSLLLKVYEVEIARVQKEKEDEEEKIVMKKKKVKIDEQLQSQQREIKVEVVDSKKMKKKNSFDLSRLCACSGKQFLENN